MILYYYDPGVRRFERLSCPKRIILGGNICYLQLQVNTKCANEHIQQQDGSFLIFFAAKKRKIKRSSNSLDTPLVLLCGQTPTLLYLPMARPVRSHSRLHRCSSNRLVSVRFSPVRFANSWAYTTWPGEEKKQVKLQKACFREYDSQ